MPVKVDTDADFFADSGFIFESAWFGAYAFQVTDAEIGKCVLLDLVEAMKLRKLPKASTRRTLNLVWAHDEPLPDRLVGELMHLCGVVNARLVLVTDEALPAELEERVDGRYDAAAFA
jgi:hypothetical protein